MCCSYDEKRNRNGGEDDADYLGQLNFLKNGLIRRTRMGLSVVRLHGGLCVNDWLLDCAASCLQSIDAGTIAEPLNRRNVANSRGSAPVL